MADQRQYRTVLHQWRMGGALSGRVALDVINPATEAERGQVAIGTPEDAEKAIWRRAPLCRVSAIGPAADGWRFCGGSATSMKPVSTRSLTPSPRKWARRGHGEI
jgi:hypothetical protein